MSSLIPRLLALMVPVCAAMAADGDAAIVPAAKHAAVHSGALNNLDLRLTIGGGGGITKVRDESQNLDSDYGNGDGGKIALHLLYLRARPGGIGFAVGGGLFADSHTGEPDAGITHPKTTINASGIDVYAAFVYRPTHNWHFELPALVLSGGRAKVETDGAADSDNGWYHQSALQVGAYYTFNFGLQLGADLGGSWFYTAVDRQVAPGVSHRFVYGGGGGYLNLNAGFRF